MDFYAKEQSRLSYEAEKGRTAMETELAITIRGHVKLIYAIVAGIPADLGQRKLMG